MRRMLATAVFLAAFTGLASGASAAPNDRVECLPFTQKSAQGTRLPCPFFFFNFGTTKTFAYQVTSMAPRNQGTITRTEIRTARGGPSAAASYVIGSTWCSAGSLILASAIVGAQQKRELRSSEAFEIVGGCFVPVVGSLFWRSMFAANPQWDQNIQRWYGRRG